MRKRMFASIVGIVLLGSVLGAQGYPPYPWQNMGLQRNGYISFSVAGSAGYGIRDVSGTLQVKNSGGAWANILSGTLNYLPLAGGTLTGDLTIGTATAGHNLTVNSTLGAELTPAFTGYTAGSGWDAPGATLVKSGDGTGTVAPTTPLVSVIGTKYQLNITFSAWSAGTFTVSVGGSATPNIGSSPMIGVPLTYTITADTTASLIITPTNTSRFTISAISIKAIDTASGNVTGINDATIGRILGKMGSPGNPSLSFASFPTTGWYYDTANTAIGASVGGTHYMSLLSTGLQLSASGMYYGIYTDCRVYRDAANTWGFRSGTSLQKVSIYNTYTDGSNYERLALTGVQGASVNVTAESAGTGSANLNVVLTPKGTGTVVLTATTIRLTGTATPASASAAGTAGDICWDANYIYVCVATNTWKRTAISTW